MYNLIRILIYKNEDYNIYIVVRVVNFLTEKQVNYINVNH